MTSSPAAVPMRFEVTMIPVADVDRAKAFYQRLRAAGKPPKAARCAAARKLLHQAWAPGSRLRRFEPHHGQQDQAPTVSLAA